MSNNDAFIDNDQDVIDVSNCVQDLMLEAGSSSSSSAGSSAPDTPADDGSSDALSPNFPPAQQNRDTAIAITDDGTKKPAKTDEQEQDKTKDEADDDDDEDNDCHHHNKYCKTVMLNGTNKGRGVVAVSDLKAATDIISSKPDLHVFYNNYALKHCSQCLHRIDNKRDTAAVRCGVCKSTAACGRCCHGTKTTTTADTDTTKPDTTDNNNNNNPAAAHQEPCNWLVHSGIDLKGDTDYVRFLLAYVSRIQAGDMDLLRAMTTLSTCENAQSKDFKQFCATFAANFVRKWGPLGVRVAQQHIYEVLLRLKVNSIGFPEDTEDKELSGWAIHSFAAMLNHSCEPNCCVKCSAQGGQLVVQTLRDVQAGEELTISYVNEALPVEVRTRTLLENYRFLCSCEKCVSERRRLRR